MAHVALPKREITSEVLLKLTASDVSKLPLACRTCPGAMWQITGKPAKPEAVTVRCYCKAMHTFTWDSRTKEEILDCDLLYQEDEEDQEDPQDDPGDLSGMPPFLRQQMERQRAGEEEPHHQGEDLAMD
ncbi:hypothetical protein [Pseudomonas helleri]|uniref:hypothetical protein n=1 Tax=Pseudomonas helleri TaxID=1608996 RepID=UPI003FD48B78